MYFWSQMPVVRLLLPFVAGILATIYLNLEINHWELVFIPLYIVFIFFSSSSNARWTYRFRIINGIFIYILLFVAGSRITFLNTEINSVHHYSNYLKSKTILLAKVCEPLVEKQRNSRTLIKICALKTKGQWKSCLGKALLSLENSDRTKSLLYGDLILINSTISPIAKPQNPSEFNYKRYLQFQNINYQLFVKSNEWKETKLNKGNPILKNCWELRDYFLTVFRNNGLSADEFAVGSALILGYEDKLNPEIMSAYAASGALHVLSVSGLHIAIVLAVLNYVLLFIEKFKYGKIIKMLFLLMMLWLYATITGLSPSVLRSAAMFTLILIGKSLNRYTNIYNTLACSMFALLIMNPYLLMEVGFQLSYLAVLGIVSLQPGITNLWSPKNRFISSLWDLSAVSTAAQVATFPLGLLYFNQFPNYFLISNLIVIPVSSAILYLGMAICATAKIKLLCGLLCKLLNASIWFLNSSVKYFEKLPHAIMEGISITGLEACIIYAIICCLFLFFSLKRIVFFKSTFVLLLLFLLALIHQNLNQLNQRKIIIYNVKKAATLDLINGETNYFFADSTLLNNKRSMLFHIKHNWWDSGIEHTLTASPKVFLRGARAANFRSANNLILFYSKKILVVNQYNRRYIQAIRIKEPVDFLVVSDNSIFGIEKLIERIKFKKIIFDSSNSRKFINLSIKQCKENSISYYDVASQGAFEEQF